jgi:macrodomain Ter protein organizer (MatP/YcbG family)
METLVDNKRKLIDIRMPVFVTLSEEAQRQQLSLKRLIELMLENAAAEIEREHPRSFTVNEKIRRLIGSAKPQGTDLSDIQDDRLQYLLSK